MSIFTVKHDKSGFTIVEMAISLAIITVLLASVFAILSKSMNLLADVEASTTSQSEGSRAASRLVEALRETGRTNAGELTYPRVEAGGQELHFLLPTDRDGNGFPYSATTGELEWDSTVYVARADADHEFHIYAGDERVYYLGRHIHDLNFRTVAQDTSLGYKEIRITFEIRKQLKDGNEIVYPVEAGAFMRN